MGFASYGFPESHAASFAIITYASCYLKCHHPELFVTGLLNAQPMGFYSPRALIADAQRHGVKFLPVCVQNSNYDYSIEGEKVRVGFRALHGIKEKHIERVVTARPFRDLTDFIRRTELPKGTLTRLAAAGAFHSFGLDAREALWRVQAVNVRPDSLFFGLSESRDVELLPTENDWQRLQREYQGQGYSLVHHPLGILRPALVKSGARFRRSDEMVNLRSGEKVRVAGLLALQQRPPTAKGFAFLTLEDESGVFNIVIVPQVYERFRLVIVHSPLLWVDGVLEKAHGVVNIRAREIRALPVDKLLQAETRYDFQKCFDDHTIG